MRRGMVFWAGVLAVLSFGVLAGCGAEADDDLTKEVWKESDWPKGTWEGTQRTEISVDGDSTIKALVSASVPEANESTVRIVIEGTGDASPVHLYLDGSGQSFTFKSLYETYNADSAEAWENFFDEAAESSPELVAGLEGLDATVQTSVDGSIKVNGARNTITHKSVISENISMPASSLSVKIATTMVLTKK